MKSIVKYIGFTAGIVLLSVLCVFAQTGKNVNYFQGTPANWNPLDPKRLFVIPVADVLGSMEINTGGGTIFGVQKTEKRPFLGHIRFGLGDVAEVELSTVGIVNQLTKGSGSIPTGSFKLKLLSESRMWPSVTGALRSSLWHSEIREYNKIEYKFERRIATLYFVASKKFFNYSIHGGICINDMRVRTKLAHNDMLYSPTPAEAKKSDKDYYNKNILGGFAGLLVSVNPRTRLMIEVEEVAKYNFDEERPQVTKKDISTVWLGIAGVRFFFLNWLSLDTGVMYRSDYYGIGDAQIDAGININTSLTEIAKKAK